MKAWERDATKDKSEMHKLHNILHKRDVTKDNFSIALIFVTKFIVNFNIISTDIEWMNH